MNTPVILSLLILGGAALGCAAAEPASD